MFRTTLIWLYICAAVGCLASSGQNVRFTKYEHLAEYDNLIPPDVTQLNKSSMADSIEGCAYSCNLEKQCGAYIFKTNKKECHLLNKYAYDVETFLHEDDTQFYIRVDHDNHTHKDVNTDPSLPSTITGPMTSCLIDSEKWYTVTYPDGSVNLYKLFMNKQLTQYEARIFCQNEGGRLPVITTTEKQTFLFMILKPCIEMKVSGFIWIDGTNKATVDGYYYTSNNIKIPEDTGLWYPGQPESRQQFHCIKTIAFADFKFYNIQCHHRYSTIICEKLFYALCILEITNVRMSFLKTVCTLFPYICINISVSCLNVKGTHL